MITTTTIDRTVVEQALEALEKTTVLHDPMRVSAITALKAALAQQAVPAEPVAWLRVIDEAMVTHHLGVADPADDYETAKRKMNNLLCTAQDIGAFFAKTEPVQEPVAYRHLHEDGWEYYDAPTGEDCAECQALYTPPPQQIKSAEPVAWWYKGESWFDGDRWHDNYEVTKHERVAKRTDQNAKPLYFSPHQGKQS